MEYTGAIIEYPGYTYEQLDREFIANRAYCNNDALMDVSVHIYNYYKRIGNIKKALFYKEIYADLKDEILAHNQIVEVQRISLNRIVDEKNAQIQEKREEALRMESALALEEEQGKWWKYILSLIIALAVAGIVIIYQRYTTKKKLVEQREEELTKERQQRQLLLNRLEETRSTLVADVEAPKVDSSDALMNQLSDRNWPNFLLEFELVYPGFFQRLDELTTTSLTKNERRLCCLIRLNLSNKEIAEYVVVTPESVKKG